MICKYDDGNGWCTSKFEGFGCIKERCEIYAPKNDEGNECSGIAGQGIYCRKYNRFFCAGKENCTNQNKYNRKLKMNFY
ncbi:MAG: hypothetical protein JSW00_01035 [Thermoplasmata archaeon]|nr:MAG: hypothetical protein JSW00_01035 [Thermoplasmata archaeon]